MYKDLRKHAKKIYQTSLMLKKKQKTNHAFFIQGNIKLHAAAVSVGVLPVGLLLTGGYEDYYYKLFGSPWLIDL